MKDIKTFNIVDFITEYESGQLDENAIIEGFQALIDNGIVWRLQGHYQRTASNLIESGLCYHPYKRAIDYKANLLEQEF